MDMNGPLCQGYCSELREPKASLFQAVGALAAAHRQPRGGSHSFRGMMQPLSPSPQVGDKPNHACDPAAGLRLFSPPFHVCVVLVSVAFISD